MKFSRIFAAAAAMTVMASAVSCNKKEDTEEKSNIRYYYSTEAPTEAPTAPPVVSTEPVEAAADGPRLSINNVTAKAGEVAKITISIENAEKAYSMCGYHITYPDILVPEMIDEEKRFVKKEMGDASEYNAGSVAMEWRDNKTAYLVENKLGSIFFTEVFDGDYGYNGDVVSFFLKVPEDAESGTVYPVDFMYIEGDIFQNMAKDAAMEKYVFENWKGGSITVE